MRLPARVVVAGRTIGGGAPTFVVAEAGVNHNGDLDMARRLVDAAADAGADAVKFQTFRADALVSQRAPKAAYQRETTGIDESQRDMLRHLELGRDAHADLAEHAERRSLLFFSTPFDEGSADLLEAIGVALLKVPSGEITNLPLLRHLARKGRPLLVSTGMSTLDEVERAVAVIQAEGCSSVALLHCVSAYPAPAAETNLRAMDTLRDRFHCPVGLSDHSLGVEIAIAAVARGAEIVEKHLTLDRNLPGPDHHASLDPKEFTAMVRAIRAVESALGNGDKRPMPCEADTRRVARRSLVAAGPIRAGDVLTRERVAVKRPGTGISPTDLDRVVGRRVRRNVDADELLQWEDLE
ncbi:MAG: N-acetylneuraminate synthase [Candidatus Rokuibacteriota bacterium]